MTGSPPATGRPGTLGRPRLLRRTWGLPVAAHVLVLAAVLLVAFVVSRPGHAHSADEGAVAFQVELLVEQGRWEYPYPFAALDLDAEARPFPRGEVSDDAVVPYAKHPLYPVLLVPAGWVGGPAAMVLVSTLGTLAAAVLTARVAGVVDSGLTRPALWITGLASPLFFDGFFLLAHSLAAAAVAAAALACARLLTAARRPAAWSVCVGISMVLAAALRSEAVLVGLGLAVGALAVWWRRRERRDAAIRIVVGALVGTAIAWVCERAAYDAIVGGMRALPGESRVAGDFWTDRLTSVGITWFQATSGRATATSIALTITVFVLGVAVILHRFGRLPELVGAVLLACATAAYVVHLLAGQTRVLPGLMVAFPLLWVGILLLGRDVFTSDTALLLGVSGALVVIVVVLTQYRQGGGVEWGGRFFAVALPLLIPVALEALRVTGRRLGARSTLVRAAVPIAVASSLVIAATALASMRAAHDRAADLEAAVGEATEQAGLVSELGRPVVITTERLLPQLLFSTLADVGWLAPPREELGAHVQRLDLAGAERFVLVTRDPQRDLAALGVDEGEQVFHPRRSRYQAIVIGPGG